MESRREAPGRAFAFALGLVALITPLAVHLFLPVIPAVKVALALSDATAQLNFSIALLAMALATLAYGSLSDRHGRRPMLLSGLLLFLIGSAISFMAQTATTLLLGRVVQAVGAACGMTLVRTIARDAYRPEHLVRAIAYLTMFYTLGPMVSPLLGGVLIDTLGWRSVFGFAFFAGCAISAAAYLAIPETRPLASSSDDSILRSYLALLAEPRLVGYVLQSGLNTASFMTMASAAATLMKELLQRPSSEFGLYFLLFPGGFFCGTLISSRVGSRVSNELMVLLGSLLAMATIMLQGWLFFWELVTPWTFFLPGFVLTFSQGIALPYAQVGAMAVIPRLAGTAAGIGVFMQNFGGAVFAQLYGLLADGTPLPMVAILLCSGSLCLVAGTLPFVLRRGQRG
jgi:DHA1 family bicyclomycin/chloramphenicol resistance-like MFS transporter